MSKYIILFIIILLVGGCRTKSHHTEAIDCIPPETNTCKNIRVIIHNKAGIDTLCLSPQEIISNTLRDSMSNHNNKIFTQMILLDRNLTLEIKKNYSRGPQNHLFDISLWVSYQEGSGFATDLDINTKGRGCYHASSNAQNDRYEIQFTPMFTVRLLTLKQQK